MKKTAKPSAPSEGTAVAGGEKGIPAGAVTTNMVIRRFKYRYTTGPFLLPPNSGSLDWAVLNNATTAQRIRVTVFRCDIGPAKLAVPPGPIEMTIDPGHCTHNANTYPTGFYYEIVMECNSQQVFPYASVWPGHFGEVIPGTGITSASFIRQLA